MDNNERICPQCGHKPQPPGIFRKLLGLFQPKSASWYLDLANHSFKSHAFSRAIVAYSKVFQLDPTLIPLHQEKLVMSHQYRADNYMRQRNAKRAIADYSEAIRLNPASAVSLYGRSIAYIRLDRIDQAIADSTAAIRIQPDYYPAYMSRAECFYKKGDLKGAIADDTEAIRIQPNNAAAFRGRGQLYSQQGAHEQAIADFTEAIRLEPDNPQGYILRAKQYRAIGDVASAAMDERTFKTMGK
jgi:tetratricopeptide (TPR) repeat protein